MTVLFQSHVVKIIPKSNLDYGNRLLVVDVLLTK